MPKPTNKKPPQNQKEKPTLRDSGLLLSQAVIYFLTLQAYQGTHGITNGVYPTGVDKCLVAPAMSGQQHIVMPVHRR